MVEAVLLAVGPGGRGEVVISEGVDPQYRTVLHTYAHARGFNVKEVPTHHGVPSIEALNEALTPTTSAVVIQQPNFFRCIADLPAIEPIAPKHHAGLVPNIIELPPLGLIIPPG